MKRTRKVFASGWLLHLAHHADRGLIVLDEAIQGGVPPTGVRAFVVKSQVVEQFDRAAFKQSLGGEVTDAQFVESISAYNAYKQQSGLPISAPPRVALGNRAALLGVGVDDLEPTTPEAKHRAFMNRLGMLDPEGRPRSGPRFHREAHCYACHAAVDNAVDVECTRCGWIICANCGACGCGYTRRQ